MTNRERLQVAALGWVLCAQGLDMMPNASFAPVSLLLAGAMTGVCEGARQEAAERRRAAQAMTLATDDAPEPPPDGATEPSPS